MNFLPYTIKIKMNRHYTLLYHTLSATEIILEHGGEKEELTDLLRELEISNDEEREYLRAKNLILSDSEEFFSTILTTTRCNFSCVYCFQEGERELWMDVETAKKTSLFLQKILQEKSLSRLHLTFYGGEPLLNFKVILIICEELRKSFDDKFSFGIITNGFLLRGKVIHELLPLGFRWVKITLDGSPEHHERMRKTKNGSKSFWRILENIKNLPEQVNVILACNYYSTFRDEPLKLLDILLKEGLKGKIRSFYARPIFGKLVCGEEGTVYSFSDTDISTLLKINSIISHEGFEVKDLLHLGPCGFYNLHSIAINPEGFIFPCEGFVHFSPFKCGDVSEGMEMEKLRKIKKFERFSSCKKCVYLPVCAGGCAVSAFVKKGTEREILCEKKYFKKAGNEFLKERALSSIKTIKEVRK